MFSRVIRSSLFRSAGTYGLFSMVGKAIPFFLLPVLTRYLSPEDYGHIATFTIMVALFTPFMGLNSHAAYAKVFFTPDKFEVHKYLGTIIAFTVSWGAVLSVLVFFTRKLWSNLFVFPVEWVWVVPIVGLATFICQLILTAWQVREKPAAYGTFQNLQTFFDGLTAIVFIVVLGMGWQGRLASKAIVFVVFAVIGLIILRKNAWFEFKIERKYLLHSLWFGIPLLPHSFADIINTSIDRVFINHLVGTVDTGLYAVGYQIGAIIGVFANAFNLAYVPWLFSRLNTGDPQQKCKIVKLTYAYFVLITICATGLGLAAPYLFNLLLGAEFKGSAVFVIWIALGYAFSGMYLMVCNYIVYSEKTHLLALATGFGAIVNIILNYFLIQANGAIGAAQATTISFLLTFLLAWYLSAKVYPMPWTKSAFTIAMRSDSSQNTDKIDG